MDSPLGVLKEGLHLPANGEAEKGSPHIIANKAFFFKKQKFFLPQKLFIDVFYCF